MNGKAAPLHVIIQWDVRTWSRALPIWQRAIDARRPANALAIGEREGGLSLWLAKQGIQVLCTDLGPFPPATRALHEAHGVPSLITYGQQDATHLDLPDATFDLVIFKSVIGALGSKEKQTRAIAEMHRVLRPGGVLLFAENLAGTWMHAWLRSRFVKWEHYWRYLQWPGDLDLFDRFAHKKVRTTGLLAGLGRTEGQRGLLARIDSVLCTMTPRTWHTVLYGSCAKAG